MPEQSDPALPDPLATSLFVALALHRGARADAADTRLRDLLATGCNRQGVALARLGRNEAALAAFDRVLAIQPDHVAALSNRANVLHLLGRLDAALASNDRALSLDPRDIEVLYNRGLILGELERFEDALSCYDRVIEARPEHTRALGNRGAVRQVLGRIDAAIADFVRVQALRPGDAVARFNESLARLSIGDFAEGWHRYESRWGTPMHPIRRRFDQPQWRGEALPAGCTILLHAEQGYGDTLQFCRYAPLLARRARVVLEVPPPLRRLLSTLSGELRIVGEGEALPGFDLHCPLLSLPLAFGTTLATIPGQTPYLRADPAQVAAWRARLSPLDGLKVGLVWAGESGRAVPEAAARDRRRSIALARLAPLAAVPGVQFVSLQKGDAAAQAATPPPGMVLHDWTDELGDFADTAALVAALDLVISVDTAAAHLAGALGRPVWVLNRFDACWRWLRDRADSPWYPSARLFRQPAPGAWQKVIGKLAAALDQLRRVNVQ